MSTDPLAAERKADAIRALTGGDRELLSEMGWGRVFNAILNRFQRYGSQTTLSGNEALAWLEVLGDRHPESVLSALDLWAGGTSDPPKPADILGLLARRADPGVNQPPRLRRDQEPDALRHVIELLAGGEQVCECQPAPAGLVIDSRGVLWCPGCAGVEAGQVEQAREFADPTPEAEIPFADLSAIVRLKRVRQQRAARVIEERRLAS